MVTPPIAPVYIQTVNKTLGRPFLHMEPPRNLSDCQVGAILLFACAGRLANAVWSRFADSQSVSSTIRNSKGFGVLFWHSPLALRTWCPRKDHLVGAFVLGGLDEAFAIVIEVDDCLGIFKTRMPERAFTTALYHRRSTMEMMLHRVDLCAWAEPRGPLIWDPMTHKKPLSTFSGPSKHDWRWNRVEFPSLCQQLILGEMMFINGKGAHHSLGEVVMIVLEIKHQLRHGAAGAGACTKNKYVVRAVKRLGNRFVEAFEFRLSLTVGVVLVVV